MLYTLRTECPVRWTATQEKSICQDYPWPERMSGTAAEYVTRTYLQFLWLPEVCIVVQTIFKQFSAPNDASRREF